MKNAKQTTLMDHVSVSGVGVHSGQPATLTLHPASADTGLVFIRGDREIRADVRAVTATDFATVLGDAKGPLCSTAEHVLAALRGIGVDNAIVEIDGPEVPIMDGSSAAFYRCDRSSWPAHTERVAQIHRNSQAGPCRKQRMFGANSRHIRAVSVSKPRSLSRIR